MEEELKPCPFCNIKPSVGMDYYYCDICNFRMLQMDWNDAECWKELKALRAENAELQKKLNYRDGDVERSEAQINHLKKELASQFQQIESLQLSERRSKATIGELVEALKDIKAHSVEPFNTAKWVSYINYVSDKVLRSVEQRQNADEPTGEK